MGGGGGIEPDENIVGAGGGIEPDENILGAGGAGGGPEKLLVELELLKVVPSFANSLICDKRFSDEDEFLNEVEPKLSFFFGVFFGFKLSFPVKYFKNSVCLASSTPF
jgi:hypothetical protein